MIKVKEDDKLPCKSSVNELFICKCYNTEHQLIFSYLKEDKDVYVSVHLVPGNFWNRLKHAFWYILGRRSIYGDFDEFIFEKEDADRLQSVVNHLKA